MVLFCDPAAINNNPKTKLRQNPRQATYFVYMLEVCHPASTTHWGTIPNATPCMQEEHPTRILNATWRTVCRTIPIAFMLQAVRRRGGTRKTHSLRSQRLASKQARGLLSQSRKKLAKDSTEMNIFQLSRLQAIIGFHHGALNLVIARLEYSRFCSAASSLHEDAITCVLVWFWHHCAFDGEVHFLGTSFCVSLPLRCAVARCAASSARSACTLRSASAISNSMLDSTSVAASFAVWAHE